MKSNIFYGHNDLRFFYFRYRDSAYGSIALFSVVIIICLVLVFTIILPQIESYFSLRQEAVELQEQINVINGNINFINNIDKAQLNSQLETVVKALPSEKDFSGIVDGISDSAIKSGISIDDFSFNFGDGQSTNTNDLSKNSIVPVQVSIQTVGGLNNQKKFLANILQVLPLASVSVIDGGLNSYTINLQFYYKPFPKVSFKEDQQISGITSSDVALIQKLSTWKTDVPDQQIPDEVGSSSAVPLF